MTNKKQFNNSNNLILLVETELLHIMVYFIEPRFLEFVQNYLDFVELIPMKVLTMTFEKQDYCKNIFH